MNEEKLYKIKKHINWRKEGGCFIFLDPQSKRLMFYNKKISQHISNEGIIAENDDTRAFIKYLLSVDAIKSNAKADLSLDYSFAEVSAPLNVTIQITNRCNLNCIHCHRGLKNTKDLEFSTFKRIIRELRSMNVFNINISGGEPTLVSKLPEMIRFVDEAGMKITISTNGIALNKKLIKACSHSGLKNIQLSLDSFDSSKHDYIRGVQGAFSSLMKSIKLLRFFKIQFTIVTTLINQTPEEYSKIIDLAYELGASAHKTNTMISRGEGKKLKARILSIKKYKSVWIKKRKKYKNKMSLLAETMFAIQLGKKFITPNNAPSILKIGCPAGILTANMNEYGDVNPCPFFSDIVVGNIYKNSFKEIWTKSKILYLLRKREEIKICGICKHKKICGGCRARSYGVSKNLLFGDVSCFRFL